MAHIRTVPLESTSIKKTVGRKRSHPGKMVRRSSRKKTQKDRSEKKKRGSLFRRLSTKKTDHHPLQASPIATGRTYGGSNAFSKSWSCGDSTPGLSKSMRSLPVSLTHSPDSSATNSSTSSSPSSSAPNSPASSQFNRPSSLHGLKHKRAQSLKSPCRRKSVHNIPLSPLARTPSPSPMPISPTRSPSPLAVVQQEHQIGSSNKVQSTIPAYLNTSGPTQSPSPVTAAVAKKSLTRPKSCEPGSPLLRRALSPDRLHPNSAEKGSPQRKGSLQEKKSSLLDSL